MGDTNARRFSVDVQPLIDVEREEVEAFCRALHLRPRLDPTNRGHEAPPQRDQAEVLPAMERATGREVKHPIVRTADLLRDDRMDLFVAANEVMERVVSGRDGDLRFDAAMLRSLPKTVASRVVRMAIYQVMEPGRRRPWTREAVEAVLDLAEGRPGRRRDLPAGLKARRDREYVSVSRTSPESRV
jgi:tRNA(Ile)-lysidine synthase